MSLKRSRGSTPGIGSGMGPSYVRARRTEDYALTLAATSTPIPFQTADFDTDDFWEGVTNPTRLTAPVDGIYRVTAAVAFYTSASADVFFGYHVNGSAVIGSHLHFGRLNNVGANVYVYVNGSDLVELSAGAYIEIVASGSGATRTVRSAPTIGMLELVEAT